MSYYLESDRDSEEIESRKLGEETQHVAHKQHKCSYCPAPIEPGQKYWKQVGITDGEFWEQKSHVHPSEWFITCGDMIAAAIATTI